MPIRINSYRGFIIKGLLPFCILLYLVIIIWAILLVVVPTPMETSYFIVLSICTVEATLLLIVVLYARFAKPRKWFLFDENTIQVCKKNGKVETINISEVEIIKYHPFSFKFFFISILLCAVHECGTWGLLFKFKDGKTKRVGFLDLKSVEKIKGLYGDLITIC